MGELKRLYKIMAPAAGTMALAALLGILTVGANIGLLITSAYLISFAALHPPLSALAVSITGVRFFGISRAVFRYFERYVAHNATFQILYNLRVWFYTQLEPLAPARLAGHRSGDLLGRIVADVDTLQFFYLRVIAPPVVAVVILALMWQLLIGFSPNLAMLITAAFTLAGVVIPFAIRQSARNTAKQALAARSDLKAHAVDTVQGLTELAAFDQTAAQAAKLAAVNSYMAAFQKKANRYNAWSEGLGSLIMNLTVWGTLIIVVPLAAAGSFDKIWLAVIVLGVQSSFEAVLPLPLAGYFLDESIAAAKRLFAITDTVPAVSENGDSSAYPDGYGLVVSGLGFAYGGSNRNIISDISFELPPGKRLAIVGPSGAGKSTLVSLLLRFWEYQDGSITFGGKNVRVYEPESLRRYFTVVSQHTHLFNTSVLDNILIARPGATAEEVEQAARSASIDTFIAQLPDGYETPVGLNGKTLSGGQRQRLSIARALLKDAPVLILDEPTVGLDPVTEQEVMAAIHSLMEGRSTILITHRLTGLGTMDEILVLDQGCIVERGTMEQLLRQQGLFYEMWQLQRDILV